MFTFSYIHFARMVKELECLKGRKVSDFFYERNKRIGYLDFVNKKLYFDLTHPFVSFFVVENLDVPLNFERKRIGLKGLRVKKIKAKEYDRVAYIVLGEKAFIRVIALELTGRSSYFLVIDDTGRVVRKYPPYRKRQKGGDLGEEYRMPGMSFKVNIKKYFPALDNIDEDELYNRFMNTDLFFTDGKTVLPFEFENSKFCGKFSDCMFELYKKFRFKQVGLKPQESVPYSVYYKAASLLEKKLISIVNNEIHLDGYKIILPANTKGLQDAIEYLYSAGKALSSKQKKSKENIGVTDDRSLARKFLSPSGYEVLVGRSARENNRITFNIARGSDTFFHVRDYPGAHVILRNHGRPVSNEDILFCARIAKRFSRASGDSVDVSYTSCKYVRPVPGKTGRVILLKEKTVRV